MLVPLTAYEKFPISANYYFDMNWTQITLRYLWKPEISSLKIRLWDIDGRSAEEPIFLDSSGVTIYTMDTTWITFSPVFKNIEFLCSKNFTFELWVEETEVSFGID